MRQEVLIALILGGVLGIVLTRTLTVSPSPACSPSRVAVTCTPCPACPDPGASLQPASSKHLAATPEPRSANPHLPAYDPGVLFPALWTCPSSTPPDLSRPAYRSQSNEDKAVFELFFKNPTPKTEGIFLELGALDGELYSNTYFFENTLRWRGVLIEAQPGNAQKLQAHPKRSRSVRLASAICGSRGHVPIMGGAGAVAGMPDQMSDQFKDRFHQGGKGPVYNVSCSPLGPLLLTMGIRHIDFWSLDVEGAELLVLKSFDFDNISVRVLVVERNSQAQEIRELLQEKGFELSPLNLKDYCTPGRDCTSNDLFVNPRFRETPRDQLWYNDMGRPCA